MEFSQEIIIDAPRQKVWDFIWNVEEFAGCIPGVTRVEQTDDSHFNVRIEQKIGFLKAAFNLRTEIKEKREPEFVYMVGEGVDSKIAASLKQKSEVTLEAFSPNRTGMHISSTVNVFGKFSSLGFSVIKNQTNKVFAEFAKKVKARLE